MSPVTFPWCRACDDLGLPYSAIGYGLELVEPLSPRLVRQRSKFSLGADHWFAISRDTRDKLAEVGVPLTKQSLLLPGVARTPMVPLPSLSGGRSGNGWGSAMIHSSSRCLIFVDAKASISESKRSRRSQRIPGLAIRRCGGRSGACLPCRASTSSRRWRSRAVRRLDR